MNAVEVEVVGVDRAGDVFAVSQAAFRARPPIDPPADALRDTVESTADSIRAGSALLASVDGRPIGSLLISYQGPLAMFHRVSVIPDARGSGVASQLIKAAALIALDHGATRVELLARKEFREVIAWWKSHGFVESGTFAHGVVLSRPLPTRVIVRTADEMHALGRAIAKRVRCGDVLILAGDLGAGKTTLTQGIGAGLGVREAVTSPTFVLSRMHQGDDAGLVHVDAYRLHSAAELEDIDLEATLERSVTVIEWGTGIAEWLSRNRLDIDIVRSEDPADETREVYLIGVGERWNTGALEGLWP